MSEDEAIVRVSSTANPMGSILERRAKTLEMVRTFYAGGAGMKVR